MLNYPLSPVPQKRPTTEDLAFYYEEEKLNSDSFSDQNDKK